MDNTSENYLQVFTKLFEKSFETREKINFNFRENVSADHHVLLILLVFIALDTLHDDCLYLILKFVVSLKSFSITYGLVCSIMTNQKHVMIFWLLV